MLGATLQNKGLTNTDFLKIIKIPLHGVKIIVSWGQCSYVGWTHIAF
jgi:hypothetical protein